jgi:hypothetical protein
VTDGAHTAKITLVGNYTASRFVASSDGHGGVIIVDPALPPLSHAFVASMAALSPSAGASFASSSSPVTTTAPVLLRPPH